MDSFKDTLMKVTKSVTKTSGELLKSTKLSLALTAEQDNLKKIYIEIGGKVHEIYAYGGNLGKFFDEKYREIVETERRIQELRDQLDSVKGVKTCQKCGKPVERTSEFCPKCGARMDAAPEAPDIQEKPEKIDPPAKDALFCPFCGAENEAKARFCLSCGRMM